MASKKHPFPCPTTYQTALMHYVDIASPPRTHVLKEIIEYAQDEKEKEFLKSLTAPTEEAKVGDCNVLVCYIHTVKLGYKITVYNINLFTTTHMAGTDSMFSVLNVLVTTTTWL